MVSVGVVEDRRYIDCVSQYEMSGDFVEEFRSIGIIRACASRRVYLGFKWKKLNGSSCKKRKRDE